MMRTYGMSTALGRLRLMSPAGGSLGEVGATIDRVSDATLAGFERPPSPSPNLYTPLVPQWCVESGR